MATYPTDLFTDEELTEKRHTLMAYFDARIAFGRAERAENRARSAATRAARRAERAQAHAAILAANREIARLNAESAARFARWLTEQEQPATLELASCAA